MNNEEKHIEAQIKELTLLLLYLTSWKEKAGGEEMRQSWKGYDFNTLNALEAEGMTYGGKRSKTVYLTEEGDKMAEQLMEKYHIK